MCKGWFRTHVRVSGAATKRVVGDANKEVIRVETALSFRLSVFYHTFCQCECVTMVKGCSAET